MIEADQIDSITAADVRSSDDEKVGSVGQIFLDGQTGRPEWAAVKTGFFGTKEAFVPLRNAEWDGRVVRVAYDKERVRNAPHVDPDDRGLDPDQQVELYTYYGFTEASSSAPRGASGGAAASHTSTRADSTAYDGPARTSSASDTAVSPSPAASTSAVQPVASTPASGVPPTESLSAVAMSELADRELASGELASSGERDAPASTDTDTGDAFVTRSEERLEVSVEPVATERVRLSKHVVTEQQTVTVTVRREELRIERVKITADEARRLGSGAGIGEDSETEIVLYEEHPVVTTVVRPVERIRISREVVSEEQTVTGEVRKERVEVDGGAIG